MTPASLILLLSFALPLAVSLLSRDPRNQTINQTAKSDPLLEIGTPTHVRPFTVKDGQTKVISYNIRWRSGDELEKLIKLFHDDSEIGGAAIMGLQEVDRNRKRSAKTNTAKLLAEQLGMHYAWAAPPTIKVGDEEETGVAVLSVYPLADVHRIVLPNEGPGKRRRVALGATIKVGETPIRFYSVHAETRISMDKKLQQYEAVIKDLSQYATTMPAIVLGDMNTWEPNAEPKVKKLFTAAGFHTPFDDQSTFSRKVFFVPIELRLDWIWLRNLESPAHGIDKKVDISDHWPLWINIKIENPKIENPKR
jgi:endonuclease/exonuclease/phosphatase family metal-dependent hydrolase